ncbi:MULTISPECIES: deoxyribose-phosphate aldolase [Halanaerobium]|uniref:Deoxyribose-phosphate aldolase n=1 Tax=Halanaerobium kushneri TaxID=56779 RepID=A0A1N6V538_9FIRM|nr:MULTISPECIES: deoxyribose-phosphate aldolase [Halanaerobium]RCW52886.1 deoxyribose-phosphate aldolase [Halanaerobium sp. ST460_2HS_T2]SIQ73004.1 deoxyribose-phosphate aldolase [Halanaerobium kushneri]
MAIKPRDMAKMIDHTNLSPTATVDDIKKLCAEAKEHEFASVCVNPIYVPLAAKLLEESSVKVCTVVGFPLGANTTEVKSYETRNAIKNGAQEIDMVMNIGAFKSGAYEIFKADIKAVVDATKKAGVSSDIIVKVILETCFLDEEEIVKACEIAKEAGADFVKTSTGFGDYGARVEDVSIMRKTVGRDVGVKASGGIKNFEQALEMLDAGANRIGASSGVTIVTDDEE